MSRFFNQAHYPEPGKDTFTAVNDGIFSMVTAFIEYWCHRFRLDCQQETIVSRLDIQVRIDQEFVLDGLGFELS
ncbi:MAG: hypothetical protein VB933_08955 [Pseudomonadales bacterium]